MHEAALPIFTGKSTPAANELLVRSEYNPGEVDANILSSGRITRPRTLLLRRKAPPEVGGVCGTLYRTPYFHRRPMDLFTADARRDETLLDLGTNLLAFSMLYFSKA